MLQYVMIPGFVVGPGQGLCVLGPDLWSEGGLEVNWWAVDNSWIDVFSKI